MSGHSVNAETPEFDTWHLWRKVHQALSVREDEPTSNKGTNGFPVSHPLPNIVCCMVVTRHECYVRNRMMVADGLAPIWQQDICNHHDGYDHDDLMKWKHFPRYWPFVRRIHRSPVNSPHKGQWRGALMFSLICIWINGWVSNGEAGDLRRHRAHYDVIVMTW